MTCGLILCRMLRLAGDGCVFDPHCFSNRFCSSLAVSVNGISVESLISSASAASPALLSAPQPVAFELLILPARACAATSTVSVPLSLMTAGIAIAPSVTVRDSFGNLRLPNSYSAVNNMDSVLAVMYSLPSPLTPAKNFLNGFIPSGKDPVQHRATSRN
jgi:hypothetical protein